ncbi:mechanosensitive ion channel family protein [Paenibacillus arenilitoris]|uniref:Mechanosensitive ion channel family protein n=1 Tax=Paenibacillus arenilitoris TaxID=2772299 RepID=A0A927CT52_9BACL|nr:mechanosensitive ion channel family protein [Paenibacillus arenilitoris]MBD2871761.1 mechanosensitive ion channel family protein [Paenibacillus arenilitoris]
MSINEMYESSAGWLTDQDVWQSIANAAIRVAVILIVSKVVVWIIHKTINRAVLERESKRLSSQARRMTTLGKLMKNVASYVIYFIAAMLVLSEFGIDLGPLLAGAGVLGLAIGFGAQSLVKDIITGFFIVLEDQFAVGDVIQTGQFKGTVEMIGLRTTKIQSWTGEMHIIPNGMINELTNFSLNNSLAVVDISIAFEEEVDRAIEVIRHTMIGMQDPDLIASPQVLGIQAIAPTGVTIRVIAECKPNTHPVVARKLNMEIKKALDANGIEIPYPRMVTYQRNEKGGVTDGTKTV